MAFNILIKSEKTQANGAQTFTVQEQNNFSRHQLQIEVSTQPSAGTLAIAVKSPGSDIFCTIDSTIDLTALTATNGKIVDIDVFVEAIKITPSSFDADKTYNAILVSKDA